MKWFKKIKDKFTRLYLYNKLKNLGDVYSIVKLQIPDPDEIWSPELLDNNIKALNTKIENYTELIKIYNDIKFSLDNILRLKDTNMCRHFITLAIMDNNYTFSVNPFQCNVYFRKIYDMASEQDEFPKDTDQYKKDLYYIILSLSFIKVKYEERVKFLNEEIDNLIEENQEKG